MRVQKVFINMQNPCTNYGAKKVKKEKSQNAGTIPAALEELKKIKFEHNDLIYMHSIGAKLPFNSGLEAYEFIHNNGIKIRFEQLRLDDIHAGWDFDNKAILINKKYQNATSFAEILAISEAIFHEAGHAKDGDNENSIQEELDCLALNALAHKFHKKVYKDVFLGQNSFLFSEGVSLYEKLFFKFDPRKQALKVRVSEKYGFLQVESNNHPSSQFAMDIKNYSVKDRF